MKSPLYIYILLVILACKKDNPVETTVNGHVFNLAENEDYSGKRVYIWEYDNTLLQPNSKILETMFTDNSGNFSISFLTHPAYTYRTSVSGEGLLVSSSYNELQASYLVKNGEVNNNVELVVGTSCNISEKLIHDLGFDSMKMHGRHMFITSAQGTNWYYGEEFDYPVSTSFSGYYVWTYYRYLGGAEYVVTDTQYFAPDQEHILEHHY